MAAHVLQFTAPKTVELDDTTVGPPDREELLVETDYSAISPGTELLVYRDELPDDLPVDEALATLDGTFSYPVEYGYAAVGTVTVTGEAVDEAWLGRSVFAFQPHRSAFCADPATVLPLPDAVDREAGTLLPMVETAMNLLLDSTPRIGERVTVYGAGVIGLLTVRLLAAFPLAELVVVEPIEARRGVAKGFGADRVLSPADAKGRLEDMDLVIELSGDPDVLDDALTAAGFDGRIVIGSWYGDKHATVDLGGRFHRDRISIESSQVSTLDPSLRGRWDKDRRLETAVEWLPRIDTDRLITHRISFPEAARAYELLENNPSDALQVILTYDDLPTT